MSNQTELDRLVVNIELTLTSIIQGVALYFLTDSSRETVANLDWLHLTYVVNGLLLLLLFWARSIIHTFTLIRWPIEFSHNFIYIMCALLESISFSRITSPARWFAHLSVFSVMVWILFIWDYRLIRRSRNVIGTMAGERLFAVIADDQNLNIRVLGPVFIVFHVAAALILFRVSSGELVFALALAQCLGLAAYLVYLLRFFRRIAPVIQLNAA